MSITALVTASVATSVPTDSGREANSEFAPRLWRPILIAMLVGVAMAGGLMTAVQSANALASTAGFYAECSPTAVTTLAPDMRNYPDYYVVWSSTLYVWNGHAWQQYLNGQAQTAYGDNVSPGWTTNWQQEEVDFDDLPPDHYYQARITYVWLGAGLQDSYHVDVPIPHQVAQANFDFASYSNSTNAYCYTA